MKPKTRTMVDIGPPHPVARRSQVITEKTVVTIQNLVLRRRAYHAFPLATAADNLLEGRNMGG